MRISNVVYIYCVGSRQANGGNSYCSRYCCTSAIHTAIEAKKNLMESLIFILTGGIRTYGKQELLYAESLQMGDLYLQFNEESLPKIFVKKQKMVIAVKDILSAGKELEVEADLVVLVTGMVPRSDRSVGSMLKLPKGRDGFITRCI